MTKIGVLALQGAFIEHVQALERLKVQTSEVRLPEQLEGLDGLIIPGGESTTIGKLMAAYGFREKLKELAGKGLAVWGTCAGLVLVATEVPNLEFPPLGLIDIRVRRNAFGRQVDSFETDLPAPALGSKPFRAVFIRAPIIESVGTRVEVLASLPEGGAVAAMQGKVLVTTFHPELTADRRFHQYFLQMARAR